MPSVRVSGVGEVTLLCIRNRRCTAASTGCHSAGHSVTAEQQERLERLKAAVKVISDHEDALEAALDADVRAPYCLKEPCSHLAAASTLPSACQAESFSRSLCTRFSA